MANPTRKGTVIASNVWDGQDCIIHSSKESLTRVAMRSGNGHAREVGNEKQRRSCDSAHHSPFVSGAIEATNRESAENDLKRARPVEACVEKREF